VARIRAAALRSWPLMPLDETAAGEGGGVVSGVLEATAVDDPDEGGETFPT